MRCAPRPRRSSNRNRVNRLAGGYKSALTPPFVLPLLQSWAPSRRTDQAGMAPPLRGAIGNALRRGCLVSDMRPSVNPKRPKFLPLPPQARLLELFTYDPLTGAWNNRITRGQSRQARAGEPAGSWKFEKKKLLRRRVWVDHKLYYMSRLIWKYIYGVDPQAQVDHFDRDTCGTLRTDTKR